MFDQPPPPVIFYSSCSQSTSFSHPSLRLRSHDATSWQGPVGLADIGEAFWGVTLTTAAHLLTPTLPPLSHVVLFCFFSIKLEPDMTAESLSAWTFALSLGGGR